MAWNVTSIPFVVSLVCGYRILVKLTCCQVVVFNSPLSIYILRQREVLWEKSVLRNNMNTVVVYYLHRKSGNFGCNVNGKINFVFERKFSRENGISWKVDQNSQTEFSNGKCAFHLLVFTSPRSFGLDRLWSYLPRKSLRNGTSASTGHSGFDASHLLQLSTNRFFRVNGKEPVAPSICQTQNSRACA